MEDGAASLVDAIRQLVADISPYDAIEAAHRHDAISWLGATDDVFRRSTSPTVPRKHLLAYGLLVDSTTGQILLAEHRRAGLWLPSGGHVEPGEHPTDAVQRECIEELGIRAEFNDRLGGDPIFVTVTPTTGIVEPHTDVSLWYVLETSAPDQVVPDGREFVSARWWQPEAVRMTDPNFFDPHLVRMLDKLRGLNFRFRGIGYHAQDCRS